MSVIKGRGVFEAELMAAERDAQLVVVLWTANWFRLHVVATAALERVASSLPQAARYLICDPDDVPELATEFAVHDLPSFHIFHDSTLVERLSGLRSVERLPYLIQHHSQLATSDLGENCSSLLQKPSFNPWPTVHTIPKLSQSSPSTSSCDGSNISCHSFTTSDSLASFSQQSRISFSSAATTTTSERSYLPRYVRQLQRWSHQPYSRRWLHNKLAATLLKLER